MLGTLVLIYFGRHQLGQRTKTNFITFQTVDPEICSILILYNLEAVVQRCSVKKVFSEISQNLQENTCARVSFLITLQRKIHRKTPVLESLF